MSIVIDLNLVCVICLQDGELRSVFEKDDHSGLMISDKIMKCSELSIDENTKLPDKICSSCYQDLAVAFRFRQKCEAANAVFSSLQQQEDELANFELEQHKIKIPSGLKIKRIQPLTESKTYILPVHVESLPELETVEEESAFEAEACEESLEPTELVVEGDEEEGEEEEDDKEEEEEEKDEEEQQMVAVELEDYYESEEILEEHFDQEIVEIKVETQATDSKVFETLPTHTEKREIQIEMKPNVVIKQEQLKADNEGCDAEENMPPEQQNMSKRGRGRPKKTNDSPIKETSSASALVTFQGNERLKQGSKGRIKNALNAIPYVIKPLADVLKMRKRNSLSPDAKPTKICDICGNSYKYQHALNAHMRRHNNDRPFSCEFCDKAFVSAVELRRHMRVHTGHKPYACQYCERRFSDFGSRIKHERTHTGERPYNCSTCGKAFAYAHVLSVHLRTHTGEKKFQCNLCGKGFTKKAYLKTHAEQHARAAALAGANAEATEDLDGGEMTAIKNVGLEECIFTTEYIDDDEDTTSVASASVTLMNEEHLEENDNEMEHVVQEYGSEAITDDFHDIEMMKPKIEELSDDDGNYETVA